MADCAKYSAKDGKSLMKTIEQDSRVDEEVCTDDKMTPISSRGSRLGARIIEITEENCDSFHENLEFFARRRDISAEQRDHRDYSMDEENVVQKSNSHEKKIEPKINDVSENIEVHHQTFSKTSAPPVIETKSNVADSTESSRINCESCDKDRNTSNSETRPQITVKSFDMPNIDCDDQEMQQVAIKQEADDSCYEMCYESSQCEPTSTSERYRSSCEKSLQEATKRHSTEKSHHPGIENVVEKLKKNAAALQEAALPSAQKIEESVERSNVENVKLRRYSETIPKKLHLLRSCQNSLESGTVDTEISSSQTPMSEQHLKDQSGRHSPHHRDMASSECLLNENNNDSRSNNNNIKAFEDKKLLAKNEKNVSHDITAYVKPKTVWRCEVQPFEKPNVIRKSNDHEEDTSTETKSKVQRQKPAIDVSGLELLSNSIEQLEQRVGQPEHLQLDADAEKSPVKSKLISPQSESNNNNVGSPLGLLCALAEQIMEVGDKVPRKLNLESSEEISQAGRLLLNLGRSNSLEKDENKRKYIETDDHLSKRFKFQDCEEEAKNVSQNYEKDVKEQTMEVNKRKQEDALKSKEAIKNINNFSEEEINRISDERTIGLEEQSLNRDECYSNTKTVKNLQVSSDKTSNNLLSNDAFYKNVKEDKLSDSEGEMFESKVLSEESTSCEIRNNKRKMSVEERDVRESHDYKNARTKLEAKKFIAKKGNRDNEDDWPSMNATELDMRVRMADIQRQYREKQKELSKLIPKKDEKKYSGRPRKKSHSSTSSDHGTLSSPPALDLMTSPSRESPSKSPERGTPSPLASAVLTMPKCNVNLVKLGEPKSHIKLLDNIPSIPTSVPPVTSPIPALPGSSNAIPEDDEKSTGTLGYDTSSPAPTVVNSTSASKKRKVGRPRKLTCTSGSARHLTETIVAKKPKSKSSLVGYVLSSKNRHLQTKQCINSKAGYTPLPFKSGVSSPKLQTKIQKVAKMKTKPAKQTPLHNKNVISSIIAEKAKLSQEVKLEKHCSKIKPKLKAEVKVKNWEDDENDMVQPENIVPPEELTVQTPVKEMPTESVEMLEKEPERSRHDKSKKKKRKSSSSQSPNRDRKESKRRKSLECKQCAKAAAAKTSESIVNRCKLTSAHLAIDQLRVLMAMGGLFYAGRLSAVQAPDVYAITLDGERGNRPHIHSREEILQDAIVEVCPTSTKELPPGTRLCAYWSQQYRCLYPGTSVKPLVPDLQNDEKFVTVEFDDGDSGLIVLDDIRLLQPNYPVVVYDPNPLLSLGKRRRQTSTSEDKRSTGNLVVPSNGQGVPSTSRSVAASNNSFATCPYVSNVELASANECAEAETETNVDTSSTSGTEYRKKKHMKKIKKKKLLETQEGKKKHRKHRSCKEHRKHKHRKHRKHKHRHHGSNSDTKDGSRENSWEQKNEEEAITDLSNTNFSAVEETRLSEEEDETEESLVTAEKDNEAQVELEEPDSKLVDKDDDVQVTTSEPSVPIQQTEIEPEEKESTQQTQIESEEPLETDQVGDETQMESEEDVQENDEEPEEPPEPVKKKLKKASTNRASTNRATINRTSTNQGSTVRGSTSRALANRVSMNRTTTNRALTRHASTVQTSTSCSSTNRASKNRASNPTTPANPPNPVETPSPIARMLPNKRHWKWASSSRVSGGNQYFTAIKRGRETINIGDSVLFYSYRKPHEKPYIGKIVSLWLNQKLEMRVRSQWFYRPEELQPPCSLNPPGGLFESKHSDSNDVQTISHKVMVLPLEDYNKTLQQSHRHQKGYEDNDPYYYYAGFYTHPTVTYAPGVKAVLNE